MVRVQTATTARDEDITRGLKPALPDYLITSGAVPEISYLDALHIALAAVHDMDYIVSWNFKHIVGAQARNRITDALRAKAYMLVTIHTPDELTEGSLP